MKTWDPSRIPCLLFFPNSPPLPPVSKPLGQFYAVFICMHVASWTGTWVATLGFPSRKLAPPPPKQLSIFHSSSTGVGLCDPFPHPDAGLGRLNIVQITVAMSSRVQRKTLVHCYGCAALSSSKTTIVWSSSSYQLCRSARVSHISPVGCCWYCVTEEWRRPLEPTWVRV